MAAPTVTAALNAAAYAPGDDMRMTVTYSDVDARPVTVTVVVTDVRGHSSAPAEVTAVIDQPTLTIVDDSGRVWTQLSDNGAVADYRAVA